MIESSLTALEGNLSHLDLPGVIQMLSHSRQNGSLHINSGDIDGIIVFDNGQVSHAEVGELAGDDAVIHIVKNCNHADKGVYKFVHGFTPATRTVVRSATELMLQALREIDEEEPPTDEVFDDLDSGVLHRRQRHHARSDQDRVRRENMEVFAFPDADAAFQQTTQQLRRGD